MRSERSYLFCPGDRPERFAKALGSGADRVVIDLEDAVLPDSKARSRDGVVDWLAAGQPHAVMVRVNGAETPWFADDLRAVADLPGLAGVMLPKAETRDALTLLRSRLSESRLLVALIESLRGVADLRSLASTAGLQRLAFGSFDFAVEAGIRGQGPELDYVRSQLVFESALAGLGPPIDGVTIDLHREDLLAEDVARGRRFGLGAKLCIHPSQVATVNAGFSPSQAEIDWARRVVVACEAGLGAVTVDGKLVDRPIRLQAEAVLDQVP